MRNEKGLTLVELLAVVVILAIIAVIATISVLQIINNSKADAHLSNARNVLEAGKIADVTGVVPTGDFYGVDSYTLQDIVDSGLLNKDLKNPSIFSWSDPKNVYDLERSLVILYKDGYKVNLSIGGGNFIFEGSRELKDINRDAFTDVMKTGLKLK